MKDTLVRDGYVLWFGADYQFEEALIELYVGPWGGKDPIYIWCDEDGDIGVVSKTPVTEEMKDDCFQTVGNDR